MIRLFVLLLGAGVLTAAPPDLVMVLADDLSRTDCSPYGGTEVPTPNIKKLAQDGRTFTHAFVASPSCAPSRAALLTGLDPMLNGAMLNHARPQSKLKKWPAYFQDLGYEVVAFGKVGHYAQTTEYGFDHASHFKYHQDDCVAAAAKWLAARNSAKPLCLIVGTNWPHVPWPKSSPVPVTGVPPTLVDTRETREARGMYLAAVAQCDADLGTIRTAALKHLGRDHLFLFSSDHGSQFPFGKWNCSDAGVRTPLIVARPGVIAAGSTSQAMVSWIDFLPTLLEVAGGTAPETISGRSFHSVLVGKMDRHRDRIFLTHSSDGTMNRYPIRAVRTAEWKYIRNLDPEAEHHTHVDGGNAGSDGRQYWDSWVQKAKTDPAAAAVIQRYHRRPAEELYDMSRDPWEMKNLAAEPAHADRLKALRADVDAWMKANNDKGIETERALLQALKAKP
ncbi:sulfatase [soil metagenome]